MSRRQGPEVVPPVLSLERCLSGELSQKVTLDRKVVEGLESEYILHSAIPSD